MRHKRRCYNVTMKTIPSFASLTDDQLLVEVKHCVHSERDATARALPTPMA